MVKGNLAAMIAAMSLVIAGMTTVEGSHNPPFVPNADITLDEHSLLFGDTSPELVSQVPEEMLVRTHSGNTKTVLTVEPHGDVGPDSLRAQIRVVNFPDRTQFLASEDYQPLAFLALSSTESRMIVESSSYADQPLLPIEINFSNCPAASPGCNTIQAIIINPDGTVNFNNHGAYGLINKDDIVVAKSSPAIILMGSSPNYVGQIYSRNEPMSGGESLIIYTRGSAPNLIDTPRIAITGATEQAELRILNADIVISDSSNIILGTEQGTKIGTSSNQKLGFFGVTPVSQQAGGPSTADLTYDENERLMLQRMYDALRSYGLIG